MKKEYMKPQMQAVKIQQQHHILAGSPGAHDQVGGSGQFARRRDGWDEEDDEDDWDE